jgi:hypothetical protein
VARQAGRLVKLGGNSRVVRRARRAPGVAGVRKPRQAWRIGGLVPIIAEALSISIPEFPVISRGLPYSSSQGGSFGGPNDEANAIDADYGTTWDSVFTPNDGSAEWYVLDLRSVPPAQKSNLWLVWKNWHYHYYDGVAALGPDPASPFTALPRNYKIQGHASAGAQPAVGDAGWVDLATVIDNRYNQRIHTGLDFSGYNWFRFYVSASSGVGGATDSVQLQLDLRDARGSTDDSFFFYGDSITWEGFNARRPGNAIWTSAGSIGPIENILQDATARIAPVVIDAGIPGAAAADLDSNKVIYIGSSPCKYVTLNIGTNDANLANIDLNDPGVIPNGINSVYAQAFKTSLQSVIDYCVGLGKKCIIPHAPWGDLNTWSQANLLILNTLIDQLVVENPGDVVSGPDLYSYFSAHHNLLRDHLHPTYDDTDPLQMADGLTGYAHLLAMWRDDMISKFYS